MGNVFLITNEGAEKSTELLVVMNNCATNNENHELRKSLRKLDVHLKVFQISTKVGWTSNVERE